MNNKWGSIIFTGLLVILVQIILINNINFWGLVNPKIFPLFLLLFSKNIKQIYFLTLALFFGFFVGMFNQTYGICMASCVLIAFLRPYFFRIISNRKDEDDLDLLNKFKDNNFLYRFIASGLLIFHLSYFIIEMGELYNVFYIIWKSVLSTLMAVLLYALYNILFSTKADKKSKTYSSIK